MTKVIWTIVGLGIMATGLIANYMIVKSELDRQKFETERLDRILKEQRQRGF